LGGFAGPGKNESDFPKFLLFFVVKIEEKQYLSTINLSEIKITYSSKNKPHRENFLKRKVTFEYD